MVTHPARNLLGSEANWFIANHFANHPVHCYQVTATQFITHTPNAPTAPTPRSAGTTPNRIQPPSASQPQRQHPTTHRDHQPTGHLSLTPHRTTANAGTGRSGGCPEGRCGGDDGWRRRVVGRWLPIPLVGHGEAVIRRWSPHWLATGRLGGRSFLGRKVPYAPSARRSAHPVRRSATHYDYPLWRLERFALIKAVCHPTTHG